MLSSWRLNATDEAVSERESGRTGRRVAKVILLVVALGCLAVGATKSKKWVGMRDTGMERVAVSRNENTGARGDVIGPDPAAAAKQKEIYDNEQILRVAHGKAKVIWKAVYDQYKTNAQSTNQITLKQYLSMVYAQVHFHIDATAENVHLFIEDAAYGLWISYQYKTNFMVDGDAFAKSTAEHGEVARLKEELVEARSRLEGLVRRDVTNAPIANTKKAAATAAQNEYNRLVTKGNQERAAWMSDLLARKNAQSMTLLQHLHSIHLFTLYKITKTAELVQEYIWMINYTEYLRWQYGHSFVMEDDLMEKMHGLTEVSEQLMALL